MYCGHFMRTFIFSRAKTNFKLGRFEDCLSDCQVFMNQCEVNHLQRHHLLIVRCRCLRASALRSQNMLTSANVTAKTTFQYCLQLLRNARQIAESLAAQSGEKILFFFHITTSAMTTIIYMAIALTATLLLLLLALLLFLLLLLLLPLLLHYYYYHFTITWSLTSIRNTPTLPHPSLGLSIAIGPNIPAGEGMSPTLSYPPHIRTSLRSPTYHNRSTQPDPSVPRIPRRPCVPNPPVPFSGNRSNQVTVQLSLSLPGTPPASGPIFPPLPV